MKIAYYNFSKIFSLVCLVFLCISNKNFLSSSEDQLLIENLPTMMEEVFQTHLVQKKMSEEIIRRMVILFIDQFDPDHSYFLEREVLPYFLISKDKLGILVDDYKRGDFSFFIRLNNEIGQAISRARSIRDYFNFRNFQEVENEVERSAVNPSFRDVDKDVLSFPKTREGLEAKIYTNFCIRIVNQVKEDNEAGVTPTIDKASDEVESEIESFEDKYLGSPNHKDEKEHFFVFHLMKAFTASLDAHTNFLNIFEADKMMTSLQRGVEGIGLAIVEKDGLFFISQILENSSAAKSSKFKVGDELIEIDKIPIKGLELEEVIDKLKGKVSTYVEIKIKRGSEVSTVLLERQKVLLHGGRVDVKTEEVNGGIIGIATLHSFYEGPDGISSGDDLRRAIKALEHNGKLKGLILDLRDNRGGYLSQAVKVAGLFIKSGVVVISKTGDEKLQFLRDLDSRISYSGPFIILTSRVTASAAEVVAQSLKDYGVAIIVGDEQTFGKGTIQMQTVTDKNEEGPFFVVTIGRYYSVSGKSPQIEGVKADIVVPSFYFDKRIGEAYQRFPLSQDSILPAFSDQLLNVEPNLKAWYVRNYLPYLQKPSDVWRRYIPRLKKMSQERVSKNREYQNLLEEDENSSVFDDVLKDKIDELQLAETVNIMKDLINLQTIHETSIEKK